MIRTSILTRSPRQVFWWVIPLSLACTPFFPVGFQQASGESRRGLQVDDERAERLGRVRFLADRIDALKTARARVAGLALLGRSVCKEEMELAREIFQRAQAVILSEKGEVQNPQGLLLPAVAECDPTLALALRQAASEVVSKLEASADIDSAFRLMQSDPGSASRFAQSAISSATLTSEQRYDLLVFLLRLRQRDSRRADSLFLQVLTNLRLASRTPTLELMLWGNYVFTAKWLKEKGIQDGISLTRVGPASVYDLSADREGVPTELSQEYLAAALDVLSRPMAGQTEQTVDLIVIGQFLEKANRHTPDLSPSFALLRERLLRQLPVEVQSLTSLPVLTNFDEPVNEWKAQLEGTTDVQEQQALAFKIACSMIRQREFESARSVLRKITRNETRSALTDLLDWEELQTRTAKGDLEGATRIAYQLREPLLNSLGLASVADRMQASGRRNEALALLSESTRKADQVAPELRANLWTALCWFAARVEKEASLEFLKRALQERDKAASHRTEATNGHRMGKDTNPFRETVWGFSRSLELEGARRDFHLRINNIPRFDLSPELIRRLCGSAKEVEQIIAQGEDEDRRAQGWGELGGCYARAAGEMQKK